jgi:uncharacterized membrane protein
MKTFLIALMVAPFMVVLDLFWVGLVANNYYKSQLGPLFAPHIQVWPVIAFYLIYIFALSYFAVTPGVAIHSWARVAINAAILGLAAYATYDLVNLGITAGWPLQMSLVDMTWGIVVSTLASSGGYFLATRVFHF